MITQVDDIILTEKLFNCLPWKQDDYDEVSEQEYEFFINDCIRVYTVDRHSGGVNIENRKGDIVAFRTKNRRYFIIKE